MIEDSAAAIAERAALLSRSGRAEEARAVLHAALERLDRPPELLYQLGALQQSLNDLPGALESYRRCLESRPNLAEAHNNLGTVLERLGRLYEALDSFRAALLHRPGYVRALTNLGNVLRKTGAHEAAAAALREALELAPTHAPALVNLGQVQFELRCFEAAGALFRRALAHHPGLAEAHFGLGAALCELHHPLEALEQLELALQINPRLPNLRGLRAHVRRTICDWRDHEAELADLEHRAALGECAAAPFVMLALSPSPPLQRRAAEAYVRRDHPPDAALGGWPRRAPRARLTVGYFSADFREHAIARLMAEVIELHDRTRFDVVGFAWGRDAEDAMRSRLRAGFERFIDVEGRSDLDVARLARELGIDVAVDLGGFTLGSRPRIFALRAAPVQVSYLGFLGTMGAPYMDYLIADRHLVPASARVHYSEKLLYLPCYQANDSQRSLAERWFSREELGLPAEGFVYCCFNGLYKIGPQIFACWMKILRSVADSVLLLQSGHPAAEQNLRREAERCGVAARRLVFGARLPVADYLARYRTAQLFLDTLPYNAGTTASDALWAGLPVLTCRGDSFAGRMAGSLLEALQLPELICPTLDAYVTTAIELARDPARLARLCTRLELGRRSAALFDTPRFVRHLESGYRAIHARARQGLPPDHVHVQESA
jgi:predicted O-linked N-acetylglucosamine transferase (SPINDLY family)